MQRTEKRIFRFCYTKNLFNFDSNSIDMETILITVKDKSEKEFISDLLKRMKIESKVLNLEEKEDFALGEMMSKIDRTQKVSRDRIMAKLGRT